MFVLFYFFFFKKGAVSAWKGERNGVISGHFSILYIPVPHLLMLILPLTVRFCQNIIDTLCERFFSCSVVSYQGPFAKSKFRRLKTKRLTRLSIYVERKNVCKWSLVYLQVRKFL